MKKIMLVLSLSVFLCGCSSDDPSSSTLFFPDIASLRTNDGLEISSIPKQGGISESSIGYIDVSNSQIDSILLNYVTPNSVGWIDESIKEVIRYGLNARNNWIDHLLHTINDGSIRVEDESVFENTADNPMISSDDILIYIDGQDHLKVVARNENAASLEGIFICKGISTLIDRFYTD